MKKLTPMKAIRQKCLECACGSSIEVRLCPCAECPLYQYRFGRRPKTNDSSTEQSEVNT